jgi:hypothetical protein
LSIRSDMEEYAALKKAIARMVQVIQDRQRASESGKRRRRVIISGSTGTGGERPYQGGSLAYFKGGGPSAKSQRIRSSRARLV